MTGDQGLALLAAVGVMARIAWLHAPLARMGERLTQPFARLIARYRSRP